MRRKKELVERAACGVIPPNVLSNVKSEVLIHYRAHDSEESTISPTEERFERDRDRQCVLKSMKSLNRKIFYSSILKPDNQGFFASNVT